MLFSGAASAARFEALTARNPFAPTVQAVAGPGEVEQGPLEFRGLVVDASGTAYSLFDSAAAKGFWISAEDTSGPIQVKSYDAASGTLEVSQNGKALKLKLKQAVIQAGQSVAAMMPPPVNPVTPGKQPGIAPGGNANDARRLEAVAAEVRRRRALRNAAQNPAAAAQQSPAPTPAAAPEAPSPDIPSPPLNQ